MRPSALSVVAVLALAAGAARAQDKAEYALPNGLVVRLCPRRGEEKVVVLLGVRAGVFEEPAGLPHLAHLAEHLAVFGAPAGSEEARAIGRWYGAGQANAETLGDFMYFDLQVAPGELPLALRVQAQRLRCAEPPEGTLAREAPRALGELEQLEKSDAGGPLKFALSAFVQGAFHGRALCPIKAATRAIAAGDVRAFRARTFRPDHAALSVVGDFDPAAARPAIEAAFAKVPRPDPAAIAPRKLPPAGAREVRWDAATRHLLLAWPAPPAAQTDHARLTLAAVALTGRLYRDEALARLAKLPWATTDVEGLFLVHLQLREGADASAVQAMALSHIARLAPEELAAAGAEIASLLGPVDIDRLPIPPGTSKLLALANLELQRQQRRLAWGPLAPYAARAEALDAALARRAASRLLDPKAAFALRVEPGR